MKISDIITETFRIYESTGGLARRWIEVQAGQDIPFVHTGTKEEFRMVGLVILPQDPSLRYEDESIEVADDPDVDPLKTMVKPTTKPTVGKVAPPTTKPTVGKVAPIEPDEEPKDQPDTVPAGIAKPIAPTRAIREAKQQVIPGSELLDRAIQDVVDGMNPPPEDLRVFGPDNSRAAIVVIMEDETGAMYVYARKSKAKRSTGPNGLFWQTKEFADLTGLWAQTAQMKKAAIPIEPTDFVSANKLYGINELVPAVASSLKNNSTIPAVMQTGLPLLLNNVLRGSTTPVPGLAEFQPAIEVKLSELAVPLALSSGNFVGGDYATVNRGLLAPMGTGWGEITGVSFPPKAEKLIDATVYFDENKIDISVKDGKGGARPSTKTIAETLERINFGSAFKKRYEQEISRVLALDAESAIEAPISMALKMKLLTNQDVNDLRKIYGNGKAMDPKKLSPTWKKLIGSVPYYPDTTHPEYQQGYHLLAVIAKAVVAKMNENSAKTTEFFKAVLNQSSLVQVNAKTKADKAGGLAYTNFNVTWPPVFEGAIEVDADSYTARTRPSRKISFSFNPIKKPKQVG